MSAVQIAENVYWVGAIDWDIRHFHGHTYTVKRGTTYNAYLIIDEQVTLVDTVHNSFTEQMLDHIKEIVPLEKISTIVMNHVEPDHSGALPRMLEACPNAQIYGTQKCKDGLLKYYYFEKWNFNVVKTGDSIKLGKRTIRFVEAAMLHWPDSMFSFLEPDGILLPNDAFGQHYATTERFADQVDESALMDEAAQYYGNILWPFSTIVLKKIEQLKQLNLNITMIAPSHGLIWRKDPLGIVRAYESWAKNETTKSVVIVYETMWGMTEKLAQIIAQALQESGVSVWVFDVTKADRSEIIRAMMDAKGYVIGSSTHDNSMLPTLAGFLHFLEGLKPKNRVGCAFGSYGWAGGAAQEVEKVLQKTGIAIAQPSFAVQYAPSEDEKKQCYEFGKHFAQTIQGV